MKEVKNNKKPFIFYYAVVILIMILLNLFLFPKLLSPTVTEVGYDTFLSMLEEKQVQEVQLDQQENQIIFSDKSDPVNYYETGIFPDPDLLIRPGGEMRISNFLLWQCAYAEFYFTDVLWPDFSKEELHRAIAAYQGRSRRFGGV